MDERNRVVQDLSAMPSFPSRLPVAAIALLLFAQVAHGETFLVTRTDDPLPDGCQPGDCSLREAATAASANDPFAGSDTIELAAGNYTLIRGALQRPDSEVELVGAGSAQTRIDTDAGLFDAPRNHALSVRGVTVATTDFNVLTMGATSAPGHLVLDDVTVPVGGGSVVIGGHDGFEATLDVRNSELRDTVQCNTVIGHCTLAGSRINALYVNPGDTPGPSVRLRGSTVDGDLDEDGQLTGIVVHHAVIVDIDDSVVTHTTEGIMRASISDAEPMAFRLRRVTYEDNAVPMQPLLSADVQIIDSVFRDNPTRALYAEGTSTWSISGTSFVNNTVNGNAGGAIVIEDSASVDIRNSTFSGNTFNADAAADGARGAAIGYRNGSGLRLDLNHVTIVRPVFMPVGIQGTGVGGYGGTGVVVVNVGNSVLAGSCRFDAGALHHNDGNLESPGNSCALDASDNQVGVDADDLDLGVLGDHGGPTPTYLPGDGSFASDAADIDACAAVDQRGYPRPPGGACDVGAVELGAVADVLFADGFE